METLIGVLVSRAAAENAIAELLRIPVPQESLTFLTANPDPAGDAKGGSKFMGACLGGIFAGTAGLFTQSCQWSTATNSQESASLQGQTAVRLNTSRPSLER